MLTSFTADEAKKDRLTDKVASIHSQYLDSNNSLVLNYWTYTACLKQKRHAIIRVDSLLKVFEKKNTVQYIPDSAITMNLHATRIFKMKGIAGVPEGNGVCIELNRHATGKGFYIPSRSILIRDSLVQKFSKSRKLSYGIIQPDGKLAEDSYEDRRYRHPAFIYYMNREGKQTQTDYVIISIAPSDKKMIARYVLIPVTFLLDIATSPIQTVLVIYTLSKIPIS